MLPNQRKYPILTFIMPIIHSAIKKLRQDKKRTLRNETMVNILKKAVKIARRTPTKSHLAKAYSVLDQAVKKNVIHKNKAARLKSRLVKMSTKNQKLAKAKS